VPRKLPKNTKINSPVSAKPMPPMRTRFLIAFFTNTDWSKNHLAQPAEGGTMTGSQGVFDQSVFVKNAIKNLVLIGGIGLALTGLLIFVFFGSLRGTLAVFLSIPLSVLATFIALSFGDNSINTMILGGLALAFSRLINNSVVVLGKHLSPSRLGETPEIASQKGGDEVAMPVLASTLTTAVVFFPVIFLYGVSRYLFSALALAVVLSLFASYVVALTVVPLFCAKFIRAPAKDSGNRKISTFAFAVSSMDCSCSIPAGWAKR